MPNCCSNCWSSTAWLRLHAREAQPLAVADILRWPGMFGADAPPLDEMRVVCSGLLGQALDEFTASRAREGEKLKPCCSNAW